MSAQMSFAFGFSLRDLWRVGCGGVAVWGSFSADRSDDPSHETVFYLLTSRIRAQRSLVFEERVMQSWLGLGDFESSGL